MRNNGSSIKLFEYGDYRQYLKDWFRAAKAERRSYSFRSFSKKAGFRTSNFLLLVMQGKRNLTEDSLKKVVVGLDLNRQEQEFFRNLIFFNQAKTHPDKNLYYQRLLQSRKFSQLKAIEKRQYEYYSTWYHPVVRELVASKDYDGSPEWIAQRLSPQITPVQVAKSIELLEGLGFIRKNGNGRWVQTDVVISTGPELNSVIVHNYHKALLDLAKSVMDQPSMKDRDVSALTLGVRRERVAEIRSRIRRFREELLSLASQDTEPEEVVQLNLQFFPVTTERPSGNGKGDL